MEKAELRFTREAVCPSPNRPCHENRCPGSAVYMESIMLGVMCDLPAFSEPVEVVINAGVVKEK